jgi:DNA-binding NtrC family response regulator
MADDWVEIDDACGLPATDGARGFGGDEFDGTRITIQVGATLAEIERQTILSTLRFCRENKREAAKMLGISLKTLYTRLALYRGLENATGRQ